MTDAIYENLDGAEPSVHLCDFPEPGARDEQLEWEMQVVRDAVELGRAARAHAKLKVRQPLREAVVVAADREREAIERLQALLTDELNVKSVRYVSEADELGRFELKPNYRALGPRFGKQMPQVAAAIASLDPARLRDGGQRGHQRRRPGARDRARRRQIVAAAARRATRSSARARTRWRSTSSSTTALRREGLAREVVHAVQAARKTAGPQRGGPHRADARRRRRAARRATRAHEEYVAGETLATSVDYDGADGGAAAPRSREGPC